MGCTTSSGARVDSGARPDAIQVNDDSPRAPDVPLSPSGGGRGVKRSAKLETARHSKIFAEGLDVALDVDQAVAKSAEVRALLSAAVVPVLKESFPAEVSDAEIEAMIDCMAPADPPLEECEVGGMMVVERGSVELLKGGTRLRTCDAGSCFGEVTLLGGADDGLRMRALDGDESTAVWILTPEAYRRVKALAALAKQAQRVKYLEGVRVLSTLSKQQTLSLAQVLEEEIFGEGEYLMRQGEPGLKCYFVVSGETVVTQQDKGSGHGVTEVARRGAGECIGEAALLNDAPRNASVMACQPTTCLTLGKNDFDTLLGPLSDILDRNANFRALRALPSLETVDDGGLQGMVESMTPRTVAAGETLVAAGTTSDTLYIIKTGEISLTREDGSVAATLAAGDHCGDTFHSRNKEELSAVVGPAGCEVLCLVRETFRASMAVIESADERRRSAAAAAPHRAVAFREAVPLDSLRTVAVLGSGSFGQVSMVEPTVKPDGMDLPPVLALKKMSKKNIVASKQLKHVLAEREIACSLPPSNNVVKLYTTYQDDHSVYMLMELAHGGELFDLLNEYDCTGLPTAQFFIANVLLGLEHLHENGVIYRDLKPENVVMADTGYLKLIDLGFAKRVPYSVERNGKIEELARTFTLCGTPEYLAPECVLHHGHDRAADYWAMGILLFEILFMQTPFGGAARGNLAALFRQISRVATHSNRPRFPASSRNIPNAVDLINKLLNGNPQRRLGMTRSGTDGIKQHPFFHGIDWEGLKHQVVMPPHVPDVDGPFDVQNFQSSAHRTLDFPSYSGDQAPFAGF